jgi:hypothetical protein
LNSFSADVPPGSSKFIVSPCTTTARGKAVTMTSAVVLSSASNTVLRTRPACQ